MELKRDILIKDNYKDLLNSKTNELIVTNIMNDSEFVFTNTYFHQNKQDKGQSDIYNCLDENEKYDVKILFYEKMCHYVKIKKLDEWGKCISKIVNEVYNHLKDGNYRETTMYKEMVKRLNNVNSEEACILFFPFPFSLDFEDPFTPIMGLNNFSIIYKSIIEDIPSLSERNDYIIYPNIENKIVILRFKDNTKEFINKPYIRDYIEVVYE